MRVLLSDGSGLTARQAATLLSLAGHAVEVLSPDPRCLCRFTRHVRRVHPVPAYGDDPFGWLDAALDRYARSGAEVLLPTQEQVAVLSAAAAQLADAGVRTVVPPFDALVQVQDKVSATATLERLDLPQPATLVLRSAQELAGWDRFPVYLKTPIGTATSGVCRVDDAGGLRALPPSWAAAAGNGGLVAQRPVEGQLVMVQSVFADGELVACHAAARLRLGPRGGASHKRSIDVTGVRAVMRALGAGLRWHGALSADVILGAGGPTIIDVNPRLVEPVNAYRSGVDLLAPLLELARARPPRSQPPGRAGESTHQLLLAVLGAAEHGGTRRLVAAELADAALRRGPYHHSSEELTPARRDPRAAIPVVLAAVATLARPASWQRFAAASVNGYALTPRGWTHILDARAAAADGPAAARGTSGDRGDRGDHGDPA